MKCVACHEGTQEITTTFSSNWGDYTLTIQGVKAYKCPECDELIFSPEEARMIQNITAGFYDSKLREKPEYINVEEVADLLRVSNQTVYNMIRDGRLKATKVGREWRFSRSDVESLIKPAEGRDFSVAARSYDVLTAEDEKIVEKYYEELKDKEEQKCREE